MKVDRSDPNQLSISMSRLASIPHLLFTLLFLTAWYGFMAYSTMSLFKSDSVSILVWIVFPLFYLAPLLLLNRHIIKPFKRIFLGEAYVLDRREGTIKLNNEFLIAFNDIANIQVRTIRYDSDTDDAYRLSLVKEDGSRIEIDESSDRRHIMNLAEDLADYLNVGIYQKE